MGHAVKYIKDLTTKLYVVDPQSERVKQISLSICCRGIVLKQLFNMASAIKVDLKFLNKFLPETSEYFCSESLSGTARIWIPHRYSYRMTIH